MAGVQEFEQAPQGLERALQTERVGQASRRQLRGTFIGGKWGEVGERTQPVNVHKISTYHEHQCSTILRPQRIRQRPVLSFCNPTTMPDDVFLVI